MGDKTKEAAAWWNGLLSLAILTGIGFMIRGLWCHDLDMIVASGFIDAILFVAWFCTLVNM